ncbi:hypothetical protein J5N97_022508 [Dioscorea zingiberensis]|uniref:Uncharacterized protein n=1 Tax=Dioscorea zingiberensis TaxID=325984 RepID=A0A9D5HAL6_9LILI|nr:hypothetical protein J5N97_022508 [Dioscorea zingiberensis]
MEEGGREVLLNYEGNHDALEIMEQTNQGKTSGKYNKKEGMPMKTHNDLNQINVVGPAQVPNLSIVTSDSVQEMNGMHANLEYTLIETDNNQITHINVEASNIQEYYTSNNTNEVETTRFIQVGEGITLDLTKMKPRLFRGTWILGTDEAWKLIDGKETQEDEKRNRDAVEPVATGEPPNKIPKSRGRPRKTPVHEPSPGQGQICGNATTINTRGRRKKTQTPAAGTDSTLTTVPLTLIEWPDRECFAAAITVGMDPDQPGSDMETYLSLMRNREAEWAQGEPSGSK